MLAGAPAGIVGGSPLLSRPASSATCQRGRGGAGQGSGALRATTGSQIRVIRSADLLALLLVRAIHLVIPFVAAVVVIGAGLALTAGDDESATSGSATEPNVITIDNFEFIPPEGQVEVGAELTFDNVDSSTHTATSGESPSPDGVFDTGTIQTGESATLTVEEPGEFVYFCEFHPFMRATLTVSE